MYVKDEPDYVYRAAGTLLTQAEVDSLRERPLSELSYLERQVLKDIDGAKQMRKLLERREYNK